MAGTARTRTKAGMDAAKRNKDDEFYTRLEDIEAELQHYMPHFAGKTVLCNCDDPYESNFFKYFALNFERLGLKKLIASCYSPSPIQGQELALFDLAGMSDEDATARRPYKIEITAIPDANNDGAVDLWDVEHLLKNDANVLTVLKGNGDFRSDEALDTLAEADIVVTNPPFSLFREFLALLLTESKKFVVLGNPNALTYKEIFPLIQQNEIWWGVKNAGGANMYFLASPEKTAEVVRAKPEGSWWRNIDGVPHVGIKTVWYTNLDHPKRHENLVLVGKYNPEDFPEYDNYDGIEVGQVADIPEDYTGVMGVPITFLDKYSPEQFEIVGIAKAPLGTPTKVYPRQTQIDSKGETSLVRKLNDGPAIKVKTPPRGQTYYEVDGEYYVQKYARLLVRRIGEAY